MLSFTWDSRPERLRDAEISGELHAEVGFSRGCCESCFFRAARGPRYDGGSVEEDAAIASAGGGSHGDANCVAVAALGLSEMDVISRIRATTGCLLAPHQGLVLISCLADVTCVVQLRDRLESCRCKRGRGRSVDDECLPSQALNLAMMLSNGRSSSL